MSRIVIIEGPDNCGKDTLINKLKKDFKNIKVIHACAPDPDKSLYDFYSNGIIHETVSGYYDHDLDVVIHNRSMYGEYVYGPKYRNESKESIARMINELEVGQIKTFIFDHHLNFILLTSSDASLLANNDDGLSFSSKIDDIQEEINAFDEVFNLSIIKNKKRILVNDGRHFRDKDDIYKEVSDFIKSTGNVISK